MKLPLAVDPEALAAHRDHVTAFEHLLADARAVDEGASSGAKVEQDELAILTNCASVMRGGEETVDHDVVVRGAAESSASIKVDSAAAAAVTPARLLGPHGPREGVQVKSPIARDRTDRSLAAAEEDDHVFDPAELGEESRLRR